MNDVMTIYDRFHLLLFRMPIFCVQGSSVYLDVSFYREAILYNGPKVVVLPGLMLLNVRKNWTGVGLSNLKSIIFSSLRCSI